MERIISDVAKLDQVGKERRRQEEADKERFRQEVERRRQEVAETEGRLQEEAVKSEARQQEAAASLKVLHFYKLCMSCLDESYINYLIIYL